MELFEMKKDQVVLSEGYIKVISYKTGKRRTVQVYKKVLGFGLQNRWSSGPLVSMATGRS